MSFVGQEDNNETRSTNEMNNSEQTTMNEINPIFGNISIAPEDETLNSNNGSFILNNSAFNSNNSTFDSNNLDQNVMTYNNNGLFDNNFSNADSEDQNMAEDVVMGNNSLNDNNFEVQRNIFETTFLQISPNSSFSEYRKKVISKNQIDDSYFSSFRTKFHSNGLMKTYKTQNMLKSFTVGIVLTYKQCSPHYGYDHTNNILLKKPLTSPSTPANNNGSDNIQNNLIVYINDMIGQRYVVKDILGKGTFGEVFRCEDLQEKQMVALKIIKNDSAYLRQAKIEKAILEHLNTELDPNDEFNIVRLLNSFIHAQHLCFVFELLNINLFELIKRTNFQGLSINAVQTFTSQILDCLSVLYAGNIIHCDLKPENILVAGTLEKIKVIDFGSACYDDQTIYSYIQSRFYRSPEVLLGSEYGCEVDMWSLGCICGELFLGLPLFPGASQYNQVARIVEMLGLPSSKFISKGKQSFLYFKKIVTPEFPAGTFEFKNEDEHIASLDEEKKKSYKKKDWKRYFNFISLHDLVMNHPYRDKISNEEKENENFRRKLFIDFLKGLLNWNPAERWTPNQARCHPFLTGDYRNIPPNLEFLSNLKGAWFNPPNDPAKYSRFMKKFRETKAPAVPPQQTRANSIAFNNQNPQNLQNNKQTSMSFNYYNNNNVFKQNNNQNNQIATPKQVNNSGYGYEMSPSSYISSNSTSNSLSNNSSFSSPLTMNYAAMNTNTLNNFNPLPPLPPPPAQQIVQQQQYFNQMMNTFLPSPSANSVNNSMNSPFSSPYSSPFSSPYSSPYANPNNFGVSPNMYVSSSPMANYNNNFMHMNQISPFMWPTQQQQLQLQQLQQNSPGQQQQQPQPQGYLALQLQQQQQQQLQMQQIQQMQQQQQMYGMNYGNMNMGMNPNNPNAGTKHSKHEKTLNTFRQFKEKKKSYK